MKNRRQIFFLAAVFFLFSLLPFYERKEEPVSSSQIETEELEETKESEEKEVSWEEEVQTLTEEEKQVRLEEIKTEAAEQNVPKRVISLIDQTEETVDFVRDYPEKYQNEPAQTIGDSYDAGEIPVLFQWDERWGYQPYGKGTIANCGCGPACVSMVIAGLTQNPQITPYVAAQYSMAHGMIDENDNTYWQFLFDMPTEYGLEVNETMLNEEEVKAELEAGHPIICSVGPGDFTDGGHFILLTGYLDGAVKVNDPFSRQNSEKTWNYSEICDQIQQMWVYAAAGE